MLKMNILQYIFHCRINSIIEFQTIHLIDHDEYK